MHRHIRKVVVVAERRGSSTADERLADRIVSAWRTIPHCHVVQPEDSSDAEWSEVDAIFVVGGDSARANVVTRYAYRKLPFVEFPTGAVDCLMPKFSSAIASEDSLFGESLRMLADGQYVTRAYPLLIGKFHDRTTSTEEVAFREIVVRARGLHLVRLQLSIDGKTFSDAYVGDGLILATPRGSMGHALSAGGPIIHPDVSALSIIPICPQRVAVPWALLSPIILPATSVVGIQVINPNYDPVLIYADAQEHSDIIEAYVCLSSAEQSVRLLSPGSSPGSLADPFVAEFLRSMHQSE